MSIQRINSNTLADGAALNSVPGGVNFRNRIINGDMRIDQRNAGAAVTINSTAETYTLDRWVAIGQGSAGVYTVDQVQDAPSGFIDSMKVTVTTADATIAAGDYYWVQQKIEGHNSADLAWGSASAKPITLSFWVKSSVTGTFGGAFSNSAFNYSYAFEYTINSANTWEYKTISISGATAGTWLNTNGTGVRIYWDLGNGTNFTGTAGSWQSAGYNGTTGAVKIIETVNATWFITGVQFEAGSVATPFERRPFGTELALCQRYYATGTYTATNAYISAAGVGVFGFLSYKVTMRTAPTVSATVCQTQASGGSVTNRTFNLSGNDAGGFAAQLATTDPVCYITWQSTAEI